MHDGQVAVESEPPRSRSRSLPRPSSCRAAGSLRLPQLLPAFMSQQPTVNRFPYALFFRPPAKSRCAVASVPLRCGSASRTISGSPFSSSFDVHPSPVGRLATAPARPRLLLLRLQPARHRPRRPAATPGRASPPPLPPPPSPTARPASHRPAPVPGQHHSSRSPTSKLSAAFSSAAASSSYRLRNASGLRPASPSSRSAIRLRVSTTRSSPNVGHRQEIVAQPAFSQPPISFTASDVHRGHLRQQVRQRLLRRRHQLLRGLPVSSPEVTSGSRQ